MVFEIRASSSRSKSGTVARGRGATRIGSLVAVLVLMVLPVAARAADVWRMAGTFNGWNAGDAAWTLSERGNVYVLEREVPEGTYSFKFVKDGAWERGHLGLSGAGDGTLEQPGADITLRVKAKATYAFTLDPSKRAYTIGVVRAERPKLEMRLLGVGVVGRPFLLDLSGSVATKAWDASMVSVQVLKGEATVEMADVTGSLWRVVPAQAQPVLLQVELKDPVSVLTEVRLVVVLPDVTLRLTDSGGAVRNERFEPQADGSSIALVRVDRPTTFQKVEVIGLEAGEKVTEVGVEVTPGTYAAIIRDGEIVTNKPGGEMLLLHAGNWIELRCNPGDWAESVYLASDLNGWAGPESAKAARMISTIDGGFATIVNPPAGPLRYRFMIDGDRPMLDPGTPTTTGTPGGPASVRIVGPRSNEFPPAQPSSVATVPFRHDATSYRDFAPISKGLGLADIGASTLKDDVSWAFVRLKRRGADGKDETFDVPMTKGTDEAGFDRWTARVMSGEPVVRYEVFVRDGIVLAATLPIEASVEPLFETPDWAKGAVWYQIFPERFRNGNPLNDPHGPGVYQMPWTADWYSVSKEEEAAWRERYKIAADAPWPARKGGNLFNVVWDRRYGGDLQGVAEQFDYLKKLGIDAIYFNPVFEAESMHKYDATDFRHIDDNLAQPAEAGKVPETYTFKGEPADEATWEWTPADRYFAEQFLPQAKKSGIRVVLDGVFNHTGRPFFAFKDIEEKGDKSAYKDWFYVTFDEQGKLKDWVSWFNTGALPKFRQKDNGDLVEPVKRHIFGITRRWMDPNNDGDPSDGIDGWRLDVALDVGQPFWRDWRKLVKSINPQAVIIAEIWDEADPYLRGDAYDTQMHYPFAKPVVDWLGVRPEMTGQQLSLRLADAFDDAPQTNLIHQNLFGSHDTDRYVSMLQNPGRPYDEGNRPQDHDYPYKDVKPSDEIYARSLLGVAMQATYTGAPMVYYGDEVGMWGADDPTDRKPYPWPDKGEMQNPDERPRPELLKQYTQWLNLRHDPTIGPVLRYGSTTHIESGDADVFLYERSLNGVRVVVAINRKASAFSVEKLIPQVKEGFVVGANSAKYWVINEARPSR